jgi:hypothetical protein
MNALEQNIMEALVGNPRVDPDAFGGDVILRGTVGSVVQREESVRRTRHMTGAKSVTDRLRLGLLDASRRADADTEAAVLDALNADTAVRASDIDVPVRDSTVTLSGSSTWPRNAIGPSATLWPSPASLPSTIDCASSSPSRPTTWPSASPTRSASTRSSAQTRSP